MVLRLVECHVIPKSTCSHSSSLLFLRRLAPIAGQDFLSGVDHLLENFARVQSLFRHCAAPVKIVFGSFVNAQNLAPLFDAPLHCGEEGRIADARLFGDGRSLAAQGAVLHAPSDRFLSALFPCFPSGLLHVVDLRQLARFGFAQVDQCRLTPAAAYLGQVAAPHPAAQSNSSFPFGLRTQVLDCGDPTPYHQ
jgi:hypothetical protein